MTGDILLDVSPEDVLDVFLLKSSLDDQLIAPVDGSAGPQLGKQEQEKVLGLPVQHLGYLIEVCKCRLLTPNSHNLVMSHL